MQNRLYCIVFYILIYFTILINYEIKSNKSFFITLINKIYYTEYKRTIFYQIYIRLASDRYQFLKTFIVFALIFTLLVSSLYPLSCKYFFIPVFILLVFDFLFLSIFIHYIKVFIFNLKVHTQFINKQFLFAQKISDETQYNTPPRYSEYFIMALPTYIKNRQKTNDEFEHKLLDMKNFIWIWRLYKQSEMKPYVYFMAIVTIETFFIIIFYKLYYWEYLDHSKGFFVFMFLLIWTIYLIVRLKSLLGLDYFRYLFTDYQKRIELRKIMRNLTIYQKDIFSNKFKLYNIKDILKELSIIKNTLVKILDYFIGFVTTVLFVSILTFILGLK
jgi:hypothetical protein